MERLTTCSSQIVKTLVNKYVANFEAKLEGLVEKLYADYVFEFCDKRAENSGTQN